MYKFLQDRLGIDIPIMLLTLISVFVLFILESHQGFSLLDEGYLWYGAQRVMMGEVPLRDFMSYDIGRYYWSAAFMSLIGSNGLVALRVGIAVFEAMALYIGLVAMLRSPIKQRFLFWLLTVITLLAWMAPQYRVFDISLPIMLVGVLAFLVEQPSTRRYFLLGLSVGFVAIFGRNHGMYGVAGSLGVIAYLAIKRDGGPNIRDAFLFWLIGVVAGYLPVMMFLIVVPGFAQAYWESIRVLFELKATNFPLPIPWPWLVPFGKWSTIEILRGVTQGIFFILIVVFGIIGLACIFWARRQNKPASPILVASIFLALPYAHFAFSRADLAHLAPGIPPFLMGIMALSISYPAKFKWLIAILLCSTSLLVMLPSHSAWYCYSTHQCVQTNVAGDDLAVDRRMANNLAMLTKLANRYAPDDRTFVVAPSWPGAYAALGRKSPMWAIYLVLAPPSAEMQQSEIERIKAANPGFVVIYDATIDGREDMRFRNTHPIVEQYIRDNFEPLQEYAHPAFQTYKSKTAGE